MSEPSRRRRVVEWFLDHLADISVENGFRTDAGLTLVVGQIPTLSTEKGDAAIAIAVLIGEDEVRQVGNKFFLVLPIDVHILRVGLSPSAWLDVEDGLADIKQSVEQDPYMDGLLSDAFSRGTTATHEREAGSTNIGARIRYLVPQTEAWGQPEA
jgi:hypothetical protein